MNIKTFKSLDKTKTCASRKREKKKESAQAQRIVNVAKEIEYEMKEVLKYAFLPSLSYLFDDNGFMIDSKQQDYFAPEDWPEVKKAFMVDAMGNVRKVRTLHFKTFKELGGGVFTMVSKLCQNAYLIDFIFDTHLVGSVKDLERRSRCSKQAIEVNNITKDTILPVHMDTF